MTALPIEETQNKEIWVEKSTMLTLGNPNKRIVEEMNLPLSAQKMFDIGLAYMDEETLCAEVDIKSLAIKMIEKKGLPVDASKIPAYCNYLASGVKALRDFSIEVPFLDPQNENIIIWKPIALLSDYERIENTDQKTTTKIKMQYNPLIKPLLVNLVKSKYDLPVHIAFYFKGEYTYKLHSIFLAYEYLGQPLVFSIKELRSRLKVGTKKYKDDRNFVRTIISSIEELNESAEIRVEVVKIKTGKAVTHLKFIITRVSGVCCSVGENGETVPSEEKEMIFLKQKISYIDILEDISNKTFVCFPSHLDLVLQCLYEVLHSPKKSYTINGQKNFPLEDLQKAFSKIGKTEVKYALLTVYENQPSTKNLSAYYRSVLYNSVTQAKAVMEMMENSNVSNKRELDSDEIAAIHRMMNDPDCGIPQE